MLWEWLECLRTEVGAGVGVLELELELELVVPPKFSSDNLQHYH